MEDWPFIAILGIWLLIFLAMIIVGVALVFAEEVLERLAKKISGKQDPPEYLKVDKYIREYFWPNVDLVKRNRKLIHDALAGQQEAESWMLPVFEDYQKVCQENRFLAVVMKGLQHCCFTFAMEYLKSDLGQNVDDLHSKYLEYCLEHSIPISWDFNELFHWWLFLHQPSYFANKYCRDRECALCEQYQEKYIRQSEQSSREYWAERRMELEAAKKRSQQELDEIYEEMEKQPAKDLHEEWAVNSWLRKHLRGEGDR